MLPSLSSGRKMVITRGNLGITAWRRWQNVPMAWDQSLLNVYLREKCICILFNHHFFFQGWGKQFENVHQLIQKCVPKSEILTPSGAGGKEPTCQCRGCKRSGFHPWVGMIPRGRERLPTPVFWPGESRGLDSRRGCKEFQFHFPAVSISFTSRVPRWKLRAEKSVTLVLLGVQLVFLGSLGWQSGSWWLVIPRLKSREWSLAYQ